MSLMITLPNELEVKVQQAAARRGWNAEDYIISAVEVALKKPSLDELLAPVRRQFAESGMTEEELTDLVKQERRAMWCEKQSKKTE